MTRFLCPAHQSDPRRESASDGSGWRCLHSGQLQVDHSAATSSSRDGRILCRSSSVYSSPASRRTAKTMAMSWPATVAGACPLAGVHHALGQRPPPVRRCAGPGGVDAADLPGGTLPAPEGRPSGPRPGLPQPRASWPRWGPRCSTSRAAASSSASGPAGTRRSTGPMAMATHPWGTGGATGRSDPDHPRHVD